MQAKGFVLGALGIHAVATLLAVPVARRLGRRLRFPRVLFGLLLPVCGPVICWMFATVGEPADDILSELKRNKRRHAALADPGARAARTVPLEEAFLINTPQKRRELMMNLLRSDPRKYLDLLLIARSNEDPETAHYATATLTEVQRQMQLELQQSQIEAGRRPGDAAACVNYVRMLKAYVDSGLLEGRLLKRQQMALEQAMEALPKDAASAELLSARVENLLALERAPEARACAESMLTRWPEDELGWLEMLRVCVETHDRQAMETLRLRAGKATVAWSRAGLERMRYFMRHDEETAMPGDVSQEVLRNE